MRFPPRIKSLVWVLLLALGYLLPATATSQWQANSHPLQRAHLAADDGLFERHFGGCTNPVAPDEAARINQRYQQQLQALLSGRFELLPENAPGTYLPEVRVGSSEYNSICLSSCYDYMFRLCPF